VVRRVVSVHRIPQHHNQPQIWLCFSQQRRHTGIRPGTASPILPGLITPETSQVDPISARKGVAAGFAGYGVWPASDEVCCSAEEVYVGLEITRWAGSAAPFHRWVWAFVPEVRSLQALDTQRRPANTTFLQKRAAGMLAALLFGQACQKQGHRQWNNSVLGLKSPGAPAVQPPLAGYGRSS
jgi:hypothetical protein